MLFLPSFFQKKTYDYYRRIVSDNESLHTFRELVVFYLMILINWLKLYFLDHLHTTGRHEVKGQVYSISWSVSQNYQNRTVAANNFSWHLNVLLLNTFFFAFSLVKYMTTFKNHDPFLTPCLPSNPWQTDDDTYWELNMAE